MTPEQIAWANGKKEVHEDETTGIMRRRRVLSWIPDTVGMGVFFTVAAPVKAGRPAKNAPVDTTTLEIYKEFPDKLLGEHQTSLRTVNRGITVEIRNTKKLRRENAKARAGSAP